MNEARQIKKKNKTHQILYFLINLINNSPIKLCL